MAQISLLHVLYALSFQLCTGEAAKILGIFLGESQSHYSFNNAVMKSLMEVGHQVTLVTPFPKQAAAENYTSIVDFSKKEAFFLGQATPDEYLIQNLIKFFDLLVDLEYSYCSRFLNLPEIQKILKSNEKLYDVVYVEVAIMYNCVLHVAEKMKVPVIGTIGIRTWTFADYVIHNPNHPAYIPNEIVVQKWNLNYIFGRMMNVWNSIVVAWYKIYVIPSMIEKFHRENINQLHSLGKYINMEPELIFYNNYPSILPKPMNPNAIDIGGIHAKDTKPLTKHIQKFIDEAKHGVILFSLGSVVKAATMDSEKKNAFKDAFAEIPQRVIWKFEEKLDNLSENVLILDWLPQRDILEHEKVIAFISHCGLGATNEAIYTATPVVACPLFGDQPDNAELLENSGAAVHLDFNHITKQTVLKALNEITNNTKYYDNMQKVSKTFKDRPMTPQQSVVYWTEYVLRHNGASHLKSPASKLYLYQYWLLDVVFVFLLILGSALYLLIRIFKIIYAYFMCNKTVSKVSVKPNNKKL